jgi:hypothetical protein
MGGKEEECVGGKKRYIYSISSDFLVPLLNFVG